MKRAAIGIVFLFLLIRPGFTEEIKKPIPPKPPTESAKPITPGTPEKNEYPRFPSFLVPPRLPEKESQTSGPVREIEKYDLIISGAFPNGDTKRNVADTIRIAQYILYSDKAVKIKLFFNSGSEYIYHLRNPRSKVEIGAGIFRETFDTVVQAGKEFLLEQYSCELYYNNDTITSFNLIGSNRVIVLLVFSKKI